LAIDWSEWGYINDRYRSGIGAFANQWERADVWTKNRALNWALITNNGRRFDYGFDLLASMDLKRTTANNGVFNTEAKRSPQNNNATDENGNPTIAPADEVLSDEEAKFLKEVQDIAARNQYEMYIDAYMSPMMSDIKWRLGQVVSLYLEPTYQMYTRTSHNANFPTVYWGYGHETILWSNPYTTLFFPPYKIGMHQSVFSPTNHIMASQGPDAVKTYNQDTFMLSNTRTSLSGDLQKATTEMEEAKAYYTDIIYGKCRHPSKDSSGNYIEGKFDHIIPDNWRDQSVQQAALNNYLAKKQTVELIEGEGETTGFTFRDPGMKAISDNIQYIQYLVEKVTGVVSTYLTEWDLSVYMQEQLMMKTPAGANEKLWLNYRIKKDNPLATTADGYNDDRALCFNVVGSSVSKLFGDCIKYWRPSDYPLSAWWSPYRRGKDYATKYHAAIDDDASELLAVSRGHVDADGIPSPQAGDEVYEYTPYPEWFDEKNQFDWNGKTFKELFRHDDFIKMALSCWFDPELYYWKAFYYLPGDGMSEYEILIDEMIEKLAGRDDPYGPGTDEMIATAKDDCIASGGEGSQPENASGTGSKMAKKCKSVAKSKGKSNGGINDNPNAEDEAQDKIEAARQGDATGAIANIAGKPDATTMGKYTGLNRFSPCIYGGPHGSDYSPTSSQAYFEGSNTHLRNSPRVSADDCDWFESEAEWRQYGDANKYYKDPSKRYKDHQQHSFPNSLEMLKHGVTSYTWQTMQYTQRYDEPIEGRIQYVRWGRCSYYVFPTTYRGASVSYHGGISYRGYTYWDPNSIWYVWNWWYWWYSYYNEQSYHWWGFYAGYWGWWTTQYGYWRCGSYSISGTMSYKKYLLHDEPYAPWTIAPHKWSTYTVQAHYYAPYWSWWRLIFGFWNIRVRYSVKVQQNVGYRLMVSDPYYENRVVKYMVQAGRGQNAENDLFFLEGNLGGRFWNGPASIFKAKVCMSQQAYWYYVYVLRSKKVKTGACSYKWVYWTQRQMKRANGWFMEVKFNANMPFFEDCLHMSPWTNQWFGSESWPVQIQKPTWKLPTVTDPASKIGQLSGHWPNYHAFWTAEPPADEEGDWTGTWNESNTGMRGIGLLCQIPGANMDCIDTAAEKFSQWMSMPLETYQHYSLRYLPMRLHHVRGKLPNEGKIDKDLTYVVKGDVYDYSTFYTDYGLQMALARMWTRATFFAGDEWGLQPYHVSLDAPFRNLYSALLEQVSYTAYLQQLMTEALNFNLLGEMCSEYVDKQVQKACGLKDGKRNKDDWSYLPEDSKNPLYNYWLAQFIKKVIPTYQELAAYGWNKELWLLIEKLKIIISFINRQARLQWAANQLWAGVHTDATYWTWAYVKYVWDVLQQVQGETALPSEGEKFAFGYLNLLYEYRKFFISKRLNREDGTLWIMRHLEAILPYTSSSAGVEGPPPSPSAIDGDDPSYKVVFYELNNTTSDITNSVVNEVENPEHRLTVLYVQIQWATKAAYDKWIEWKAHPNMSKAPPEIVEIYNPRTKRLKYATKPVDGEYTLISTELLDNNKNKLFNALNPTKTQKPIYSIDDAKWFIKWGNGSPSTDPKLQIANYDGPTHEITATYDGQKRVVATPVFDCTPITWQIFQSVNPDKVLEYSHESVSADQLACLVEQGADFWTVFIPRSLWPRHSGYKSKLILKKYEFNLPSTGTVQTPDAYQTILGTQAYQLYPITEKQRTAVPGIAAEIDEIKKAYERQVTSI
jgi:hypothetical protein